MDESELVEIEGRILEYPVEARRDILKLLAELRSVRGEAAPARAQNSALYDSVTGLLNGGAYGVRFAGAMARATRYQKSFAVMSVALTLSRDTPDSDTGNHVLKLVAQRLGQCVRAADTLARIDFGKFAIILEDLSPDGQIHTLTEKVQRALSQPFEAAGKTLYPDASISVRYYPTAEATAPAPADLRRS